MNSAWQSIQMIVLSSKSMGRHLAKRKGFSGLLFGGSCGRAAICSEGSSWAKKPASVQRLLVFMAIEGQGIVKGKLQRVPAKARPSKRGRGAKDGIGGNFLKSRKKREK